jgi:hypothetical protein
VVDAILGVRKLVPVDVPGSTAEGTSDETIKKCASTAGLTCSLETAQLYQIYG